jgi:acetyl-CoA carboxylase biotin carboxylase subunit
VRWDGWIEPGSEVSLHYDSLLGKLIVWGESRERAIMRMRRALKDLVVVGVPTSREFHQRVMLEPAFVKGDIDIGYWDNVGKELMAQPADPSLTRGLAVAAALLEDERRPDQPGTPPGTSSERPADGEWGAAARREGLR